MNLQVGNNIWTAKVLTIYPEMFPGVLGYSVTGRALTENLWALETINIRNFGTGKHRNVDGQPTGGGAGMVLKADVIDKTLMSTMNDLKSTKNDWPIIYLTPRGKPLNHNITKKLSQKSGVIIICGRFEGIDERVLEQWNVIELSIGDFVISGGELAAMVLIDACSRHIPNVLGNIESSKQESFSNGLLEHPQYTRPANWKGHEIPEVLLSGNHKNIEIWRKLKSESITKKRRPDLWRKYKKTKSLLLNSLHRDKKME